MHGICGEAEDADGGNEMHRICLPCAAKKQKDTGSPSNPAKRKDKGQGFLQQGSSKKPASAKETSPSDEELELDETDDAESGEGGGVMVLPSYAELSSLFGPLEKYAESCDIREVGHFLRKAKMGFFAAHAAKPTRQSDIRSFSES